MRTSNPAFNEKAFERFDVFESSNTMTVQGTAIKTIGLLLLTIIAAGFSWNLVAHGNPMVYAAVYGGAFGGLIVAVVTCFKPMWARFTAPVYAALEGLFLGGVSAFFEAGMQGIVFQAICLTFGTLFMMLTLYQMGIIRATQKFKMGVFAATGAIGLFYLVTIGLSIFGIQVPFVFGGGWIGIGFSLFVVTIAALNLVLDFDFIEVQSQRGAPKALEWYGAFGLLVTLVWLYLEILRLLSKLNRD